MGTNSIKGNWPFLQGLEEAAYIDDERGASST